MNNIGKILDFTHGFQYNFQIIYLYLKKLQW